MCSVHLHHLCLSPLSPMLCESSRSLTALLGHSQLPSTSYASQVDRHSAAYWVLCDQLGLGFGPFLLAPLSELYGRWIIFSTTLAVFTFLQVGCALSKSWNAFRFSIRYVSYNFLRMTTLITLRFFAGVAGGVAPSLGQVNTHVGTMFDCPYAVYKASASDLWDDHDRGRWAAVLSLGPMLGPPAGNFIGMVLLESLFINIKIFQLLSLYNENNGVSDSNQMTSIAFPSLYLLW